MITAISDQIRKLKYLNMKVFLEWLLSIKGAIDTWQTISFPEKDIILLFGIGVPSGEKKTDKKIHMTQKNLNKKCAHDGVGIIKFLEK